MIVLLIEPQKPLAGARYWARHPEGEVRDMRLLPCSLKRTKNGKECIIVM